NQKQSQINSHTDNQGPYWKEVDTLYNTFQEQNGNPDNHWKLHHRVYKARELPDSDFALLRLKQGIILVNIDREFWQNGN
ncbi:16177_t:CDS:2, partial [Gigaspora margarita]